MPTYEYICEACGCELERFQTITAKPLRTCPKCGKKKLKRLIGTGAGIIFKGSGFYQTDYRSENYKKAAESEKLVRAEPAGARSATSPNSEAGASKDTDKPVSARPSLDGKETTAESKESKSSLSRRRPLPKQGEKTKSA